MKGNFLAFLICLNLSVYAQTVRCLDQQTQKPIVSVFVVSEIPQLAFVTDSLGSFECQDKIPIHLTFQHAGYEVVKIDWTSIAANNYVVFLTPKFLELSELEFVGDRWKEPIVEIPQSVITLNLNQRYQSVQTSADLIAAEGQVFLQKSQLGGGSPMIRGFAANSILISIDGIRMNNAIFRSGNLQNVLSIDPFAVEQAHVILGPGSLNYGSDAMGGVLSFQLKKIAFKSTQEANSQAFIRYSSANKEKTIHAEHIIYGPKVSSVTSLTFSDYNDLRSGSRRSSKDVDFGKRLWFVEQVNGTDQKQVNDNFNIQRESGYQHFAGLQKFGLKLNSKSSLMASLYHSRTSDIPRYDRLIEEQNDLPKYGEWSYGPQIWTQVSLKFTNERKAKAYDRLDATVGLQEFVESRKDRRFRSITLRQRTERVKVYSMNVDMQREFSPEHQLNYGFEWYSNDVESSGLSTDNNTNGVEVAGRYPIGENSYEALSVFGKYKQVKDRVIYSAGLRISRNYLLADLSSQSFYTFPFAEIEQSNYSIAGSAGAILNHSGKLQHNFSVSSGFRAPNLDDVAKVFDSAPGIVIVPNPNLRPEKNLSFDYALKFKNEAAKIVFNPFVSFLFDAMVRDRFTIDSQDSIVYDGVLSAVQSLVNSNKAWVWGYSLSYVKEFEHKVRLTGVINKAWGVNEQDEPLRHVPPLFGSVSVSKEFGKFDALLSWDFNGGIAFEDLALSEQNKPLIYSSEGVIAFNLLNVEISWKQSENLTAFFTFDNILDQHYRPYSSGISGAGRNLSLSLKLDF